MKNIALIFLSLSIILASSCNSSSDNFQLKGKFMNASNTKFILMEMTAYELQPFDTIFTDKEGQFHFSGQIDQPRFFILMEELNNLITLIIHPGDKITLSADLADFRNTCKIEGSKDSELVQKLNAQMDESLKQLGVVSKTYNESLGKPGIDVEALRNDVRIEFEKIADNHREFTIDFIEKNSTSLASLMAVYQQIDQNTFILNREEDFKYFKLVDSVLITIYPDLDYTKILNENVKELIAAVEFKNQRESPVSIGAAAPEIELPNPDGKVISLSSLRGQYVLLDFWAAWCGPCRHENPYLVDAYEKFNHKGFTIYQVSLDRTREAWLKGINDDKLGKWHHVSDLLFWNSSVVPVFQIEGIPANFLLDREGKIIARNLRGEALAAKLDELFN